MSSKWIATAAAVLGFCVVVLPAQSAPLSVSKGTEAVGAGDVQSAHYRDRYHRYHRHYRYYHKPRGYLYYEPRRYRYWHHHHRRHHHWY